MKKETYAYPSTMARLKAEYKIFILAFVFIVIADSIGQIQVPLGPGTLILFPIFYSLIMGVISGPEVLKIFNKKEVKAASKLVIVAICPFIAKLGINAGASIEVILSAGPALILQEIGNLGTIFLALPFALLLGLKREAIGATHSINRESNLALITDMFGPDSPETRGSLSIYVVGGIVGTIYFGFMTTMVAALHIFHPYALGMASGVGAGILHGHISSDDIQVVQIHRGINHGFNALGSLTASVLVIRLRIGGAIADVMVAGAVLNQILILVVIGLAVNGVVPHVVLVGADFVDELGLEHG